MNQLPLSPTQNGLLWQGLAHQGTNLEQIVCTLREQVDRDALVAAWKALPARHPMLRSRFEWNGVDEPRQVVVEACEHPVGWVELGGSTDEQLKDAFRTFLEEDRRRGVDLQRAPASRVTLIRFGDGETRCVWTFHHVLFDGRSFADLLSEVFGDYDARRAGASWTAPQRPDYAAYVEWIRTRDATDSLAHWRAELDGVARATPVLVETRGGIDPRHVGPTRKATRRLDRDATARLRQGADALGVSVNNVVQAAWALVLARYAGQRDVTFGVVRAGRHGTVERADEMVGVFMNTLPLRVRLDDATTVRALLLDLRERQRSMRQHEHVPLARIQAEASGVAAGEALFHSILMFDNRSLTGHMHRLGQPASRSFVLHERTGFPVTLYGYLDDELELSLAWDEDQIEGEAAAEALDGLAHLVSQLVEQPDAPVGSVDVLDPAVRHRMLETWNATERPYFADRTLHASMLEQARRRPDEPAVSAAGRSSTYRELADASARVAGHLRSEGIAPGAFVGVCTARSVDSIAGLYGILRAGAAYLPLDPEYPEARLAYMVEDSGAAVVLADRSTRARAEALGARVLLVEDLLERPAPEAALDTGDAADAGALAYVIYTSGSTGKPKGVEVTHRNVQNFFVGMDERIGSPGDPGTWLAVTSLSFDISVLELFWTTCRGYHVVLYGGLPGSAAPAPDVQRPGFSLFYFAADAGEDPGDKYRVLLEGAAFADEHGFEAVWTPERHFHAFGGLYPNPAVAGAAIAARTRRVKIRAGSVVLPLHNPLRVAEEWSVVDNLSGGRVGISVASGWHPNDFVLAPERFEDRKRHMVEGIETVRRLWRGEKVPFPNPKGEEVPTSILPRPIQAELPVWVTAAGNPETFRQAGLQGCNLLTHLLGQTVGDVADKVAVYRRAWKEAGHAGEGHVTLMLHTLVGEDAEQVRELVREPMRNYLRTSVDLIKKHASSWSATAKPMSQGDSSLDNLEDLPQEDLDALLDFAFERYYETSALFGTVEDCIEMIDRVVGAGIDEIGCLVDFGIPTDAVLQNLPHLARLRELAVARHTGDAASADGAVESVPGLIERFGVTHMQCTPSMARMLVADPQSRAALGRLGTMMVGGEALPPALAGDLLQAGVGALHNMYGPTETTIWSATERITAGDDVTIGRPIANTSLYVLDDALRVVPRGAVGELYIGGAGVTPGYHERPELTAERYPADPFQVGGGRMYRTGDLVRYRPDGRVEILGRVDQQAKVRGHRIELGEIEAALERVDGVRAAVVVVENRQTPEARLVAHLVRERADLDAGSALESLRSKLPSYMVPSAVVFHDTLPTTPNGKVDRKALEQSTAGGGAVAAKPASVVVPASTGPGAAVPGQAPAAPSAAEPEDGGDRYLDDVRAIWAEVLEVSAVAPDDNFFELGGHSLLTIRLQGLLRSRLEVEIPLVELFRFTTARALAARVAARRPRESSSADPVPVDAGGPGVVSVSRGSARAAKRKAMLERRRRS